MSATIKYVELLTVDDLRDHPVWEFANKDEDGETLVVPVPNLPVESLTGRLIGTQVKLANGSQIWGLLGNIDLRNPRATQHFLGLSVERNGKWIALARYHDVDYARNGPNVFARSLGLTIAEVFPISYDIIRYAIGNSDVLVGTITETPTEKLTEDELIDLAVNGTV